MSRDQSDYNIWGGHERLSGLFTQNHKPYQGANGREGVHQSQLDLSTEDQLTNPTVVKIF